MFRVGACLALCSRVVLLLLLFFGPSSIVITLFGGEIAGLCTSRAFVCLIFVPFLFLLVSGAGCGL